MHISYVDLVNYFSSTVDEEDHFGLQSFSLRELLIATDNFNKDNVLGRGGHSTMYKGRLTDGSLVAVRRLTAELKVMGNELEITSTAAHRNVLRTCGFCITEKERLLVYPYMVNGNVAFWLRGKLNQLFCIFI